MKMIQRALAVLLALMIAAGCMPAIAEEIEITGLPELMICEILQDEPAETAKPAMEPPAAPSAEPADEPTAAPTPEPAIEPTIAPSAEPTAEFTPETTIGPIVEPTIKRASTPQMLPREKLVLGLKESIALDICFSDGGSYALAYESENTKIASVKADGIVTAKKQGSTAIRVTSEFGEEMRISVKVKKAPSSLKLSAAKNTLGVGEEIALNAALSKDSASALFYTSSDESVAMVDAGGTVTAVAPGKATIKAKTYNGKTGSIKLSVLPAPDAISFADPFIVLGMGEKTTAVPVIPEGCAAGIAYESSDSSVISVDAKGKITAVGIGDAVITAKAHNGLNAEMQVQVKAAPEKIAFEVKTLTIAKGEKLPLPPVILSADSGDCGGSYSLKASNKHASLSKDGILTGKSTGTTNFTATTYNGKKAALKVKVADAPKKISLNKTELLLGLGETFSLKASLPKKTASAITYTSDDEAVAAVAADGSVTARAVGSAAITAETFNGKKAVCSITVAPAPESIALDMHNLVMGVGESANICAQINAGSAGAIQYESSNAEIAAVSAAGKIKAKSAGEVEIRAFSYNGVQDICTLTVKKAPKKVSLLESSLILSLGDRYQLGAPQVSEDSHSSTFKYKSSSTKCVSVSADGMLTAKGTGTATITVTTFNGKKDTLKVKVVKAPKTIEFAEAVPPMIVEDIHTPKIRFSNKASGIVTLSSSDETIAVPTANGRSIIAVAPGSAVITATSFNGLQAQAEITVLPLPDSVTIHPSALRMGPGDNIALSVSMPEGQGSPVAYSSSDEAVASVNERGVVSSHTQGRAEITVTARNGAADICAIDVVEAPTRLNISPRTAQFGVDEGGVQLSWSFGSEDEAGSVAFTSSDEAVAAVNEKGYVRFIAPGKVRITGKTYNGRSAHCDLEIGAVPVAMAFPGDEMFIALGDSAKLPVVFEGGCESYSLSVANSTIALASGSHVLGLQPGSTTLTAESRSGLSAACTLTVVEAPSGIALQDENVELILYISDPYPLKAAALPLGVGSVYFTSSDPDIAAVDRITGEITATGIGSCDIIAESYNGLCTARCTVTVRHLLEGVKVGIDPGHQKYANYDKEAMSPDFKGSKIKVSAGATGVSTHVTEHSINLQVGLKLRDALEYFGAEVYMTRETADVNISNKERALMMNELGVDVVLRLHCDASDSGGKGITIFTRKTGTGKAESYAAASQVFKYMIKETGAYKRGVKKTNEYTGLNWSTVPSMLIEMGFLSNSTEDKLLVSDAYQQKLVRGMVNGICAYVNRDLAYD